MQRGSWKEEMQPNTQKTKWIAGTAGRSTHMQKLKESQESRMFEGACLVDALSRYREILRRETSFLTRAVRSRNLATVAGKISYLESQFKSQPAQSIQQISEDSSKIMVSLPYLVSNQEEALDYLLHELLLFRYRIESLASVMIQFSIPISSENAHRLRIMSRALVSISESILKVSTHKEISSRVSTHNEISSRAISRQEISPEEEEAISYSEHRVGWKSIWGGTPNSGFFNDITTLSPMQFTCCTPGMFPYSAATGPALQIYSIRIIDLNPNLSWPLYVWGVVAARDAVDRNRNILFCRSLANCQKLTKKDPFLCLTGPSRAIVAAEDVTFEVELQIKYGAESQHNALLVGQYRYHSVCDDTPEIARGCCTAELRLEQLATAIQATVSVHVEDLLSFKDGCEVFCSSFAAAEVIGISKSSKIVLLDCRERPVVTGGYIHLARNVVSVESEGTVRVAIRAYPGPAGVLAGHVDFPAKHCKTSEGECSVGACKVKVVITWSLLVMDKENLMLEGYVPV